MTACATVADVLALAPNPAWLSQSDVRRALGVGYGRAGEVLRLAIDGHARAVRERAAALGVALAQADADLRNRWFEQHPDAEGYRVVAALLEDPAVLGLPVPVLVRDVRARFPACTDAAAKRWISEAARLASVGSAPHGTPA